MAEAEKTLRRAVKRSRCAIYTRKSSEEGLDQDFNSLDAQREACAAFVQSQKHEGWTVLPAQYDDGGYSGGTMERPALQRLLADIEANWIDVVVVYKVDRLTRALSDFAKLVEVFDRREVSFVSITQQFNTTTSMGRLTLNILLSFAQFERELIGERVRDKIAASKKKGMWMGGTVPLGYDVRDRKLVVNESEACTVVDIFRRYLRLKSVRALAEELAAAGIRSKRRYRADGTEYGNQRFSHGALYLMLQNRTYRGEATHKGNAYPGEHSAIVEQSLWEAVQTVLAENRVARANGANTKQPSLLTGMIFDGAGDRLTPTWSVKKGTRYRYYVSSSLMTRRGQTQASGRRIPAGNLERVVIDRLRSFFSNQGEILDAIGGEGDEHVGHRRLIDGAKRIASKLDGDGSETTKAILQSLVRRVEVAPDCVKVDICRRDLVEVLAAPSIDLTTKDRRPIHPSGDVITFTAPVKLKRAGREMKMLVDDPGDRTSIDMGLLRVVARAHDIQARLAEDTTLTVHDIAREEQVTAAYIYTLLRLPWLAPDITTAIVNGRQPPQLNAKKLMRLTAHLPADWAEQRVLLGFR
jgi:site-specific DNA recombinase